MSSEDEFEPNLPDKGTPVKKKARKIVLSDSDDDSNLAHTEDPSIPSASASYSDSDSIKHHRRKQSGAHRRLDSDDEGSQFVRHKRNSNQKIPCSNESNGSEHNVDSGIYVESGETDNDESDSFASNESNDEECSGDEVEEEEEEEDESDEEGGDEQDTSAEEEGEWEDVGEDHEAGISASNLAEMMDSDVSDGQSEKCPICLNRFLGQELGTPESCDHSFCLDCLQEWSKKVNTCPVDRQVFNLILVRKEFEGRIVQRIPVGNFVPEDEEADEDNTYCEICGRCDREDRLLLCDGCDLGYHCECLDPPLEWIPVEEWYCPTCAPNRLEADLSPEMLEEFRTMVQSRFRPGSSFNRVIARTRASEAVRSRIQRRRQENFGETQANRSSSRTQRTPVRRKIKRRRKRRRKTRKSSSKQSDKTMKSKLGTTKKKTKRRKTRRTRKKRRVVKFQKRKTRRALAAGKPLFSPTVKKRIADRLGLEKPPPGHSLPLMRKPGGDRTLESLRAGLGIQSLRILGDRDELDSFDDSYGEDSLGEVAVRRPVPIRDRSSISAILRRKTLGTNSPVSRIRISSPPPSSEPLDILGSILENQTLLHTQSKNLIIKRDGSLSLSNSSASVQQRPHGPSSSSGSSGSVSSASVSPSSGHINMKMDGDSHCGREHYSMNRTNCASFSGFANQQRDQPPIPYVTERLSCSPKRDLQKNEKSKENKNNQSDDDVDIYSDIESVGDGGIEDDNVTPSNVTFKCNPSEDNADDNTDDSSENELVIDEEAQPEDDDDDDSDDKRESPANDLKSASMSSAKSSVHQSEKIISVEDVSMDVDEDLQYSVHNDDDLRSEIEKMSGEAESDKLSDDDSSDSKLTYGKKEGSYPLPDNSGCYSPVGEKFSKQQNTSFSPSEPSVDRTIEEDDDDSDKMSLGEESISESNSKLSEQEEEVESVSEQNKETEPQNCENLSDDENEGSVFGENVSEDESDKGKKAKTPDPFEENGKDNDGDKHSSENPASYQDMIQDDKLERESLSENLSDQEGPGDSRNETDYKQQHSDVSEDESRENKTLVDCADITEPEESNDSSINDAIAEEHHDVRLSLSEKPQELENRESCEPEIANQDVDAPDVSKDSLHDDNLEEQNKSEQSEMRICPISPAADVEDVSDAGSEYADKDDADVPSQNDMQEEEHPAFQSKKLSPAYSNIDNDESAAHKHFKDSPEPKQSLSKENTESKSRSLNSSDYKRSGSSKRLSESSKNRHRDVHDDDREEGEIIDELPSRKHHRSTSHRSSHDHDDPDDFLDLAPRINISDLPRIPKKKRDNSKPVVTEEQEIDVKRTSVLARVDVGDTSEVSWKKLSRHTRERSYRDRKPKDEKALFRERELKQKDKKDDNSKHADSDRRRADDKYRKATDSSEKWREKTEYNRQADKGEKAEYDRQREKGDYERQREKKSDKHGKDTSHEKCDKQRDYERMPKRDYDKGDKHDKSDKREYEKSERQREYEKSEKRDHDKNEKQREYDKADKHDYGYEKSHEKKVEKCKEKYHKSKDKDKHKHSRDKGSPGVEKSGRERSKHKCPHMQERSKERDVRKVDEKLKIIVEKDSWKEKNEKHGEKRKSKREEKHLEAETHRCREHRQKEHSPSPFSDITSIESKEIYAKGDSIIINVSFNRSAKEEPVPKEPPKKEEKEPKISGKIDKEEEEVPVVIKEISRKRSSPDIEILPPDTGERPSKRSSFSEDRPESKRPKLTEKIQVGERYWQEVEDESSPEHDTDMMCKEEPEVEERSPDIFDDGADRASSCSEDEEKSQLEEDPLQSAMPENAPLSSEDKTTQVHAGFSNEGMSPRKESLPIRAPRSPPSPPSPRSPSPPSPPEDDSYDPCEPTRSPSPLKESNPNGNEVKPKPPPSPELPPLPPEPEPVALPPDTPEFQSHKSMPRPVPVSPTTCLTPPSSSLNTNVQPSVSTHIVTGNVPQPIMSVPNIRIPPPNFVPQTSARNPIGPGVSIVTGIRTLNWPVGAAPHLLFTAAHMQPVIRGSFVSPQIGPGGPVGSQIGPLLPPPPAPLGILSQIRPPNIGMHATLPSTPVMHNVPPPPPPPPNIGLAHQMQLPPNLSQPPPPVPPTQLVTSGHMTHPTPVSVGSGGGVTAMAPTTSAQSLPTPMPMPSSTQNIENSHTKLPPSHQDVTEVIDMEVDSPYTPGDSPLFNSMSDEPSPPQKPPSPAPKDIFDTLLPPSTSDKQRDGKPTQRPKAPTASQGASARANERSSGQNKEPASLKKSKSEAKMDSSKKKHIVKFEVLGKQKVPSSSKKEIKPTDKKEISVKMDEDQLKILDELPSSAVEMQVKEKFLKKLNRQERVVEEVKLVLKPYYSKRELTKEEYKDILRKSVPKICHNRSGEINPVKIKTLIEGYVKKVKYQRKKAMKIQQKGGKTS